MTDLIHFRPISLLVLSGLTVAVLAGVTSALGYWHFAMTSAVLLLFFPLFARPHTLLKLIVLLAPIYWVPFVSSELFELPQDILFIGLFILFSHSIITNNATLKVPKNDTGTRLLALFCIALLMGVIFSPTPIQSGILWLKALQAVAFYLMLFALIDDEKAARDLLVLFTLGQVISAAYLWFEVVAAQLGFTPPWSIPYPYNFRGDGGLSFRRTAFSNTSAHILPVLVSFLLFSRQHLGYKHRLLLSIAIVIVSVGIVLSRGRAGLVAASISSLVLLWVYSKQLTISLLLAITIFMVVQPQIVIDRLVSQEAAPWVVTSSGWQTLDRLTGNRLGAYYNAAEIALHSGTGVGLGNFYTYLSSDSGMLLRSQSAIHQHFDDLSASSAHNLYLNVASEAGMISASILVIFVLWCIARVTRLFCGCRENRTPYLMFGGVIIAQLITSCFEVEIFWSVKRAFPFWLSLVGLEYMLSKSKTLNFVRDVRSSIQVSPERETLSANDS